MSKRRVAFVLFLFVLPAVAVYLTNDRREHFDLNNVVEYLLACIAVMTCGILGSSALRHRGGRPVAYNLNKPDGMWLSSRRIFGAMLSFFYPRVGCCTRCYVTWAVVNPHVTTVKDFQGNHRSTFFALCESCWRESSVLEKRAYYTIRYAILVCKGVQPNYRVTTEGKVENVDVAALFDAIDDESGPEAEQLTE